MKKLVIVLCLLLPLFASAQNVETLKHEADSLQKIGKFKKAMKVYKRATDRVLNYQERITDLQWLQLSVAKRFNDFSVTKEIYQPYISYEYGNDGPKVKQKIKELSAQKLKCFFIYHQWLGMTGASIMIVPNPDTTTKIGLYEDARTLLVWATDTDVHFQEFNSSNVYKPMVIHNDTLRDILINHADEMIHQPIKTEYYRVSEIPFSIFEFHLGQEVWTRRLYNPEDLKNPEANSKTWLAKLRPLMWKEYKSYRDRNKAGL